MNTIETPKIIKFQKNWNHKLDCHCFTTIRLNSSKYKVGDEYIIDLCGINMGTATILEIQTQYLDKIPEKDFRLDMACSKARAIEIFNKMYAPKVNFLYTQVAIILLKYKKEGGGND